MPEQLTPQDLQVLARAAGIRMTEGERVNISKALGGFLAALRALGTAPTTEPLPTFMPRESKK